MSFGGEENLGPTTIRGRDWPSLRQFCVFMENRVGGLHDLLRHLERNEIRVIALSVANSVDCAIIRVMVNNTERAREVFNLSKFAFAESDLVGVELPDDPQPYLRVCMALLAAEINISYTYPLLYRRHGRGAIALYVDDVETAIQTLTEKGLTVITENDLFDDDEFFG
ncbi:MAG: amino acid-binding protein [Planctomycetaceae bacterium]|nr:amino acid-binding protein [Planctomycetaceae bacterium]